MKRVGLGVLLAFASASSACQAQQEEAVPRIRFADTTEEAGLVRYSPSFGAVFADLDADGLDDLVVSRHALGPAFFRNLGGLRFADETALLPATDGDRHGIVVMDLDNDGDRDLVIAGGGGDGVLEGTGNQVLRNLLVENAGVLSFENVSSESGLADESRDRLRALLPLVSADGHTVELYAAGLVRQGFPNQHYRNLSSAGHIRFVQDPDSSLHRELPSEGMDCFADLDRDGDQDLVIISRGRLRLWRNDGGIFRQEESALDQVLRAGAIALGDLDNDGDLDLVVGGASSPNWSDFMSFTAARLHVVNRANPDDLFDELVFVTTGDQLAVDMSYKAGAAGDRPGHIFIGAEGIHPDAAAFVVRRNEAITSRPRATRPGVYLWYDTGDERWHVLWQHGSGPPDLHRTSVEAENITAAELLDREVTETEVWAEDRVFMNRSGVFEPWPGAEEWRHDSRTQVLQVADFDNDGDLDVVGLRRREPGDHAGEPLLLLNTGGGRLELAGPAGLEVSGHDIYHADQLVVADVDGDGLLDLFATNGWGLHPGNLGPFRLFHNRSTGSGHYLALELAGTISNRDALGAQVELWRGEDLLGYRELGANDHRSQSSHVLHFGLGQEKGPLTVRISWPSGRTSEEHVDRVNARYRIVEDGGIQRTHGRKEP